MAEPYTSSGVKLFVASASPATQDATGYAALTWIEVGDCTAFGDAIGRSYTEVTGDFLNSRHTEIFKGQYTEGKIEAQCARNPTDVGQAVLITKAGLDSLVSWKLDHADGATTNTLQYGQGYVMGNPMSGFTANSLVMTSFTIAINTDIIEVAAT